MKARLARILSAAACLAAVTQLGADDASRNCHDAQDKEDVSIADGTYEGSWETGMVFRQTIQGSVLTQTVTAKGTFKLTVRRSASAGASQAAGSSTFEGDAKTKVHTDWPMPMAMAGQDLTGSAKLALDGDVGSVSFEVKGHHRNSGQVYTRPGGSRAQAFSSDAEFEFLATSADCTNVTGEVLSKSFDEMERLMRGAGYQVERLPANWRMKRTDDIEERIRQLEEELQRKPPAGIVRTREAEGRRLGQIADRIREEEPEEVRDCLFKIWMKHAREQIEVWAAEDTSMLNSSTGKEDSPTFREKIRRSIETSRSLCLIGLDSCNEHLNNKLWTAMQNALSKRLNCLVDGQAPLENILTTWRDAELLGEISPALSARARDAVLAEAEAIARARFNSFLEARQAALARLGSVPAAMADAAVVRAFRAAIEAQRVANLLGVEIDLVGPYLTDAGSRVRTGPLA